MLALDGVPTVGIDDATQRPLADLHAEASMARAR
jgi:hypothetical protein